MNFTGRTAIIALVAVAAIVFTLAFVAVPSLAILAGALIALVKTFGFIDIVVIGDINVLYSHILLGQGNSQSRSSGSSANAKSYFKKISHNNISLYFY